MYYNIKKDIFQSFKQKVTVTKAEYEKAVKEGINSIPFLKLSFSENFIQDIEFLNQMSGNSMFHTRYANVIIRDILEQTIEFIYLLKNPQFIDDYMGLNIDLSVLEQKHSPVDGLSLFGKKRFSEKRATVKKMAENIDEAASTETYLSLYDMYSILSEKCHNSYYNSLMDDIDMAKNEESIIALTEEQVTYLILITERILKIYQANDDD